MVMVAGHKNRCVGVGAFAPPPLGHSATPEVGQKFDGVVPQDIEREVRAFEFTKRDIGS